MGGVAFAISVILLLAGANGVVAQQQPQPGGGVVSPPLKGLEGPGSAGAYGPLLGLLSQRARAAQSGELGYPMFQLLGPENRSSFWADPEAAGNALVLQGELMMRMGEVLIKSGRELLEKAKK